MECIEDIAKDLADKNKIVRRRALERLASHLSTLSTVTTADIKSQVLKSNTNQSPAVRGEAGKLPAVKDADNMSPAVRGEAGKVPAVKDADNMSPAVRGEAGKVPAVKDADNMSPAVCGEAGKLPAVKDADNMSTAVIGVDDGRKAIGELLGGPVLGRLNDENERNRELAAGIVSLVLSVGGHLWPSHEERERFLLELLHSMAAR
jgi:hypothetical protein